MESRKQFYKILYEHFNAINNKKCSIIMIHYHLFTLISIKGHLDWFWFSAIINSEHSQTNFYEKIPFTCPKVHLLSHMIITYLVQRSNCKLFSMVTMTFQIFTTVYTNDYFPQAPLELFFTIYVIFDHWYNAQDCQVILFIHSMNTQ